mmetsp:Transcript_96808/g.312630  ORF Transcript_96808/g.312630 Transcript_96808/m.312630 type:complete len:141 (-) Transcript_96808:1039-1461(-)
MRVDNSLEAPERSALLFGRGCTMPELDESLALLSRKVFGRCCAVPQRDESLEVASPSILRPRFAALLRSLVADMDGKGLPNCPSPALVQPPVDDEVLQVDDADEDRVNTLLRSSQFGRAPTSARARPGFRRCWDSSEAEL